MIERDPELQMRRVRPAPWAAFDVRREVVFASLWSTGEDSTCDRVLGLWAEKLDLLDEGWEVFERVTGPVDPRAGVELDPARASDAVDPREAIHDFLAFLGSGPVIVPQGEPFRSWCAQLAGRSGGLPLVLGVDELALLVFPSRRGPRERVLDALSERDAAHPRARRPHDVALALAELVRRLTALDEPSLGLMVACWLAVWDRLLEQDQQSARALGTALALFETPSGWSGATRRTGEDWVDGRLSQALGDTSVDATDRLARARLDDTWPRVARLALELESIDPVPVIAQGEAPFHDQDLERLDAIFERLLVEEPSTGGALRHRPGQQAVARETARTLGARELLLVHAPTGTGKTLAYLVPTLLWSARYGVRVGVATFTRALQEQAMQREVPRALAALERVGVAAPRVALLKGRENYLCWRELKLHAPQESDGADAWWAFALLVGFALTDAEGDLDRFSGVTALGGRERASTARALESLLRASRAETACCHARADRSTCAAEIARARAERSHVVITNQAFALSRQEFFKTIVFDECEHLHDQAQQAFSTALPLATLASWCAGLSEPADDESRRLLDRLEQATLAGTRAATVMRTAIESVAHFRRLVTALEGELEHFKAWRRRESPERKERELHGLFREWLVRPESAALAAAHRELCLAGAQLAGALAAVDELVPSIPLKGAGRLRRALERARTELFERQFELENWLPRQDEVLALRQETFYDLEEDPRRGDVLAARVLLPNEFLGRHYYPQLASAVLVSATTWLRGGFECAQGYLGLDRAAHPADDEERLPCVVRAARAPDPFDYGRVLVCVPDDAPPYAERARFQDWVRGFVAHLGERTRGRLLVLFTNADDVRKTGEALRGFFRSRRIPFWFQNMSGLQKEQLGELFRERVDSILMGVDTFWYGADFAGETLEYLVIVKLPWGVPDRYHFAQCAALGDREQRRRIYLPRALAKFRQGFGRLMRRESDRGVVFVLDQRILSGQNKLFLAELPLAGATDEGGEWRRDGARLVVDSSASCCAAAFEHMGLEDDLRRRGLDASVDAASSARGGASQIAEAASEGAPHPRSTRALQDVPPEELPF